MHVRLVIRRLQVRSMLGSEHSVMEIDHDFFSTVIPPPSTDSRRAIVGFWQRSVHKFIATDKMGYPNNIFLISRQKHMLWVLIRSASARCF